jgi:hypothetical protein
MYSGRFSHFNKFELTSAKLELAIIVDKVQM